MFVGTFICITSYLLISSPESGGCSVKRENVIAGSLMYASYAYLFAEFAVKRFIFGSHKKKNQ